ncbi:MAG: alpha/beta hydrolase [Polyangiaceae bacterium]|nr:alpha/beta hydrolase [Polyangiaceae bacterium]
MSALQVARDGAPPDEGRGVPSSELGPPGHVEAVADDGWRLDLLELAPPGGTRAHAVAVLGHAMMVDRRTLFAPDRPSLAATLARTGVHTLVADLRGHGSSGPRADEGGRFDYDALVADTGCLVACARARAPGLPLFLVGNSLFGHTSLAWLGAHPDAPVAGVVGFGVCIWNGRFTASTARYWAKRALIAASAPVVRRLGRLPARRLGLGTVDEPAGYWQSTVTWLAEERWGAGVAGRGGRDYAAGLARVRCPVLSVVSDGDRFLAHPDDAALFAAALPRHELLRLGRHARAPALRGLRPGHVAMVASPRSEPLWRHVAGWIEARARDASREP